MRINMQTAKWISIEGNANVTKKIVGYKDVCTSLYVLYTHRTPYSPDKDNLYVLQYTLHTSNEFHMHSLFIFFFQRKENQINERKWIESYKWRNNRRKKEWEQTQNGRKKIQTKIENATDICEHRIKWSNHSTVNTSAVTYVILSHARIFAHFSHAILEDLHTLLPIYTHHLWCITTEIQAMWPPQIICHSILGFALPCIRGSMRSVCFF